MSLLDLTLEPSVSHAGPYEGFYKRFTPKIVLVSRFLLFICISYLPKVFGSGTGIFRDFEQTTTGRVLQFYA